MLYFWLAFVFATWFVASEDSITATLLEEVMSLKDQIQTLTVDFNDQINTLNLEIQELQLTSTSSCSNNDDTSS